MTTRQEEAWKDEAACLGADPDWFFPEKHAPGNAIEAKKLCAVCPVRWECGEYAIAHHMVHGIWGGLNYRQLRSSRKKKVSA